MLDIHDHLASAVWSHVIDTIIAQGDARLTRSFRSSRGRSLEPPDRWKIYHVEYKYTGDGRLSLKNTYLYCFYETTDSTVTRYRETLFSTISVEELARSIGSSETATYRLYNDPDDYAVVAPPFLPWTSAAVKWKQDFITAEES